jgi:hypothetical protein
MEDSSGSRFCHLEIKCMRSEIVVLFLGSFVRLEAIALGKYRSSLENGTASTASLAGIITIAHGLAGTGGVSASMKSAKAAVPK